MNHNWRNNLRVENDLLAKRTIPSIANSIPTWVTTTVYAVGDVIQESNKIYECILAHTAGTFSADVTLNWKELSAGGTTNQVVSNSITQTAHSFVAKDVIYNNGTIWVKAIATAGTSIAQAVVSEVIDVDTFKVCYFGELTLTAHGLTVGDYYYLDQTVAGTLTNTQPISGIVQAILFAKDANTVLVDIGNAFAATSTVAQVALTYGRVIALLDLASTTHINTDPGTKIPFTGNPYASGMTATAGSLTPSITGRYRADWLCMAASTDFLADGIFHVVQNGVSVGQVSYNMNEASAVNQSAGFIDVNLVAGQEVSLNYRTRHTASDGIAWDRGSYFQLTQLPTAVAPIVDVVAEYGEQVLTSTAIVNTTADITNGTFTLPSAGVWDVEYFVFAATIGGNETATVFVTDPSNIVVANSYAKTGTVPTPAGNTGNMVSQKVRIITTGATNYKLRATTAGTQVTLAAGGATSKVTWTKIAGQLPSTGQTVDYVNARLTADTLVASSAAIPYVTQTGNIPNVGGVFTLTAGKTYRLTAMVAYAGTENATGFLGRWRDITNNVTLGADGAIFSLNINSAGSPSSVIEAIVTPSTNIQVRLEQTSGSSKTFYGAASSSGQNWATIVQLGSSAITTNTRALFRGFNTVSQALTSGAVTVLNINSETFDTTNSFAANTFTCPRAGFYRVTSRGYAKDTTAFTTGQDQDLMVYKNGVVYALGLAEGNGVSGELPMHVSALVQCNAGDTLDLRVRITSPAPNFNIPTGYGEFSIEEINTTF